MLSQTNAHKMPEASDSKEGTDRFPLTKTGLLLLIIIVALALTTSLSYYNYEMQVIANQRLEGLENDIPRTTVNDCFDTSIRSSHPSNTELQHLLPQRFENATIGGYGNVDYWPFPVNGNRFLLYEVWNVTLVTSSTPLTLAHIDLLYVVNCPRA